MESAVFTSLLLLSVLTAAITPQPAVAARHTKEFFENSLRRDATPAETNTIVAIQNNGITRCSGFFVANRSNKFLLATARHCLGWQEADACTQQNFEVRGVGISPLPFVGKCSRIIATGPEDDIVLIELDLFNSDQTPASEELKELVRRTYTFLKLATYSPPRWFRLQMLGLPADRERQGQPTVSENCWILDDEAPDAFDVLTPIAIERWRSSTRQPPPAPHSLAAELLATRLRASEYLRETQRPHNCSVYAGNSGGPILIEHTQDAIGMPTTYYRDLYDTIPDHGSAQLAEMRAFVERHRPALDAEGVEISTQLTRTGGTFNHLNHLTPGSRFVSTATDCDELRDCILEISHPTHVGTINFILSDRNGENSKPLTMTCETDAATPMCIITPRAMSNRTYWIVHHAVNNSGLEFQIRQAVNNRTTTTYTVTYQPEPSPTSAAAFVPEPSPAPAAP